jgi:hypothetical protein
MEAGIELRIDANKTRRFNSCPTFGQSYEKIIQAQECPVMVKEINSQGNNSQGHTL